MPLASDIAPRFAQTDAPLIGALVERWSPRAYDRDAVVSPDVVDVLLEAARWAPSANNSQPWRFVVAHRGSSEFTAIHDALMGFNQAWADSAAVLIVNIAETTDAEGRERPWATYDLGQAVAHLSVQAQHEGLHTHQMGGFDGEALKAAFSLGETLKVVSVIALGVPGDVDALPDALREREVAPRQRLTLDELVLRSA
ncbi:nitroreductase family protein [Microbacterium rhizosphaerae]|uniref:Nitroreductase family protein n=1 Tax=Microbacterium rhizosphaerae TaxID=1678237 RepID=A0ABZ0SSZ2_9MICO|nr:nitroreductase family protein [Microbacterium rhizosphaerae]WPR90496.1 nitroreductase family protein [Microbacterium rhizosphaerae]